MGSSFQQLLCQGAICGCAAGCGVVLDHWLAVAGRFADPNIARNDRLQHVRRMRAPHLLENVPRERGARVELGHQDAGNLELGVEARAYEILRVEKVSQPYDLEVLAL